MENKEQKIMLDASIYNNGKRVELIDDAINELRILNEDLEHKHSEAFSRYMKLCDAIESTKERIDKCQKQLDELSVSEK